MAITFVQASPVIQTITKSAITTAFAIPVTLGNTIIVCAQFDFNDGVPNVPTDTLGDVYTELYRYHDTTNGGCIIVYSATASASDFCTVSWDSSVGTQCRRIMTALEYAGLGSSLAVDQSAVVLEATAAQPVLMSVGPTGTTTLANELVLAIFASGGDIVNSVYSAGTGYTLRAQGNPSTSGGTPTAQCIGVEDKVISSISAVSATMNQATGSTNIVPGPFAVITFTNLHKITGNCGMPGATISLTGDALAVTTADAVGNYAFLGLFNGSYVVKPIPPLGASFSPTTGLAVINNADVTGLNFTFTQPPSIFGNPQKLSVLGPRYPATASTSTVTANQLKGDIIVVAVNSTAIGSPAVTDTIGNTYIAVSPSANDSATGTHSRIFYCLSSIAANPANVITVHYGSAISNAQVYVWYSSVATGAVAFFDTSALLSSTNQASPAQTAAFNTTGSDEIIFTAAEASVNPGPIVYSAGSSQTFDAQLSTFTDFGVNSETTDYGLEHTRLFAPVTGTRGRIKYSGTTPTGFAMLTAAFYGIYTSFTISGRTVAGTVVTLSGDASGTSVADSSGAYSFASLTPGNYVVTPSRAKFTFTPASAAITIVASNVIQNFLGVPSTYSTSTYTLQNEIDKVIGLADIEPIFNVGGYTNEPMITISTDVFTAICAVPFPHKWNRVILSPFYTYSWQQDYALLNPDGTSVYNVEWLEQGVAFDINNQTIPKPYTRVECGRSIPQRTGSYANNAVGISNPGFVVASFPNSDLYYGVWGQPNVASPTLGNNPVANSVYTNPVGNYSQPANPISQIIDANGNLLVLTGFGTEGSAAPLAPVNSLPGTTVSGTGATTVWTVVDPVGLGIRIVEIPAQTGTVWQFNLVGQMPPVKFVNLQQTLAPLPDKYEPYFRAGIIAQLYRYSPLEKTRAKFKDEWQLWLKSLNELRELQDRELEEYSFIPDRTIMGSGRRRNTFQGAAWPYNYPRP